MLPAIPDAITVTPPFGDTNMAPAIVHSDLVLDHDTEYPSLKAI